MRTWIVAIVLVAACSGKDKGGAAKPPANAALAAPTVEVASVLATADGKPPFLLVVEDAGVRLAAASSWADLDAGKLKITKKAGPLDQLDRYVREAVVFERPPLDAVARWDEYSESDIDIALPDLEDTSTREHAPDDPPPPEDEDAPDEGEDESGGTGTAMALEEGKMGSKDADRAEGQYRMQKNPDDAQLARQQAIEQARAAGVLRDTPKGTGAPGMFGPLPPNEDGTPSRVAQVEGAVVEDGKLERLRALIVIAPTAQATQLIEIVRDTDAAIAVSHRGKLRPLRLQFGLRDAASPPRYWLEARVSAKAITIEAVPDAPIEVSDLKEVAGAIEKARNTRGAEAGAPVDVLVDGNVDVQRLIDAIVTLDRAGVRVIGMGSMPGSEELARRGRRIPTVAIGRPNAQGDLDEREIQRVVRAAQPRVLACYTKALATRPDLEGTMTVQFFITPKGVVAGAAASGVDPDVATCVTGVVKALVFPRPIGGGGVQVNYAFTMRP